MRKVLILISFLFLGVLFFYPPSGAKKSSIIQPPQKFQKEAQVSLKPSISIPQFKKNVSSPEIKAKSVLIKDVRSNTILFEKNSSTKLPIGSLTKIATALVILKHKDLEEVINVPNLGSLPASNMGLVPGEQISIKELLHGLLISSSNDAAYTLAYSFGDLDYFIQEMNNLAKELGLKNTYFSNPAGFDFEENSSTAFDLGELTYSALKNPVFKEIVAKSEYQANSLNKNFVHNLKTTNQLLDQKIVFGVKTGTTPQAGECLIALAKKENKEILIVVLGSPDRFRETKNFIDWTFNSYQW